MKRLLPLAALLAMSSVGPARAGLFDDVEARRQITEMRQELEGRIDTTSRGQIELANQNEQLRAEVARLRGQIEVLMNEVENLGARQRDFYVDLDSRLRKFESAAPTAAAAAQAAASGASPAGPADSGTESADYETALNLLKQGKYKEALGAFEGFLTKYPSGGFAPGAHFWAGNAALQTKDVSTATKHFNVVLNKWPGDTTAPDAMLGLANSQQAMNDAKSSQRTLQQLVERYPQSNAAKIAKQRLGAR